MKTTKLFLLSVFILLINMYSAKSQIVQCDTMTINYVPSSIVFMHNIVSSPDSVIKIPLINNTQTNFAYPLAKFENTTPLPSGMSYLNHQWQVFASAWNVGDTGTVSFEFYVTAPIPQNYMVTFNLFVSNFSPLSIDSCVFANTVTLNLNPSVGINEITNAPEFSFSPNPAIDYLEIKLNENNSEELEIFSSDGKIINTYKIGGTDKRIDISMFPAGVYFIRTKNQFHPQKLVVVK